MPYTATPCHGPLPVFRGVRGRRSRPEGGVDDEVLKLVRPQFSKNIYCAESNDRDSMRRRAFLRNAAGIGGIASLAGCSLSAGSSPPTLSRILLRADTGQSEQVDLTLVYAPRDDSTERPIWGRYEEPASGEVILSRTLSSVQGSIVSQHIR